MTHPRSRATNNQREETLLSGTGPTAHSADFSVGSAKSRAAARAMLLRRPLYVIDFGDLPIPSEYLPTFEELLRDWKDDGDRYTHEIIRGDVLFRSAILKDSEAFKRIKGRATG